MGIKESEYWDDKESRLIIDGENAKMEILMSIHEAQHCIRIRMYMWRDDHAGNMILRALHQKSRLFPNIDIIIEKDAFGSRVYNMQRLWSLGKVGGDIFSTPATQLLIRDAKNIRFAYVGSWWPLRLRHLRNNNHSKVFLFDEFTQSSHALIGGMNIADQYLSVPSGISVDATSGWHDYMVKITGELADSIARGRGEKKQGRIQRSLIAGVEVFMTLKNRLAMRKRILRELSRAKSSIIIEHGYFTDRQIIRRLRRLSHTGIDIQVIFPDRSDGAWHANMQSIYSILRPSLIRRHTRNTIRVLLYPGMIHAKVILIDRTIAIIGSANLTYGSFDLLHETNAIFRGKNGVVSLLAEQLDKDIAISKEIDIAHIPRYSRLLAWIQKWFI